MPALVELLRSLPDCAVADLITKLRNSRMFFLKNRNEGFDTVAWILGGIIAVLTTVDLLIWVALQNRY